MRTRVSNLICGMLLATAATPLCGQHTDDSATRPRIIALERAWNQAEASKNLKVLDALFDDTLVYVDTDGRLMNKAEFLSQVKSASVMQISTESIKVQVFDQAAIVTGVYVSRERKNGRPIVHRGRFIDTWVYKNTTWVCVAAQATSAIK